MKIINKASEIHRNPDLFLPEIRPPSVASLSMLPGTEGARLGGKLSCHLGMVTTQKNGVGMVIDIGFTTLVRTLTRLIYVNLGY